MGLLSMTCLHNENNDNNSPRQIRWHTANESIGIDNRCSATISHKIEDFIGQMRSSKRVISGYGGTKTAGLKKGTILWKWNDDTGKTHHFKITDSYYSPEGGMRLLSPQHWAKCLRKQTGKVASQLTTEDSITLSWENGEHKRTVKLDDHTNVASLQMIK